MTARQSDSQPYVLGTGDDELQRLGLQHRLWADAAHAAWKLAGINAGHAVLDVGCGPGYAACDLAEMVTRRGRVIGVDESQGFVDHLNAQAAARGLSQLAGLVGDAQEIDAVVRAADGSLAFDLAYVRWVLCFVPGPRAVIDGLAKLMKPGGRVVIHDYFNYASMTMAPRRASHDRVVAATDKSWRQRGGDPDVMARVPAMLAAAGFLVTHLSVHTRVARPGEPMWQWPDTWWRTFAPKLVAMGMLARGQQDELIADLDAMSRSGEGFIQCPPVYEVVAVKD
jgi:ubiquinone/menaquinone biosynthesis C-methylase UbiE